ncbi:MAG: GNAT family N-acetyltransferase [Bacteroidetes bacterium]|nr:GNAT family N-acetyltransferase [Bacteroidota bacterium]MDA0873710.1 GNAT family N-acetyltransferase [Bacteroidota bacterium]
MSHPVSASFRTANPDDLSAIVRMLADDELAKSRESTGGEVTEAYRMAFAAIERDTHNHLIVGEVDGAVIAVLQLTFIPNLTYNGGWRAQIEGVRVDRTLRGKGIGRQLIQFAVDRAKGRKCAIVQLTTDKRRPEVVRIYESLGFQASHEGMKLWL